MGNSTGASALAAYEITVPSVEYNNPLYTQYPCQLSLAMHNVKKDEKEQKEKVCVFKFSKPPATSPTPPSDGPNKSNSLAQKNIQKLRTLRHPFVVTYVDSIELDEASVLVTESCRPLETWLKEYRSRMTDHSPEGHAAVVQELVWGFRCVLLALGFIHNTCGLLHGNLGLHAIFVSPSGDWKLGSMELAVNLTMADDTEHFLKHQHMLGKPYSSPERSQLPLSSNAAGDGATALNTLKAKLPPYYIDIYALGQCMQSAFAILDIAIPANLSKYLTLMVGAEIKKRPPCNKLSQCAIFNSDYIKLLENIDELVISKLEPSVADISKSICAYKILPNIARILQMAVNDFPNRDAREICRQSVQMSISLISKMNALSKLDEELFVIQLWAMTDRVVRTSLLDALKNMAPVIPASAVNKHIFDNMVAGFSDSNAKLRESTLMNLMNIVDKLDEMQLQEKLVRCIMGLQNDTEPSIRTNATIFLGRIASKLKENVREKVLCTCFTKAMKDNFPHCRMAGLKTSTACVKLLDIPQIAGKVIPQAAALALDKSPEIRELALTLLEGCLEQLRIGHKAMQVKAAAAAQSNTAGAGSGASTSSSSSSSTSSSSGKAAGVDYSANIGELPSHSHNHQASSAAAGNSSWSSWSVLQGISKSLESATASGPPPPSQTGSSGGTSGSTNPPPSLQLPSSTGAGAASTFSGDTPNLTSSSLYKNPSSSSGSGGGWANLDDDLDLDDGNSSSISKANKTSNAPVTTKSASGWDSDPDLDLGDVNINESLPKKSDLKASSWGDDDLDLDVDLGSSPSKLKKPAVSKAKAAPASPSTDTAESVANPVAKKKVTKPKVAVKKLSVEKSEDAAWDDF
eukprot:gene32364-41931_t